MFYRIRVRDYIRVPPSEFDKPVKEAIIEQARALYRGFVSRELGIVVTVSDIIEIGEGVIVPGDGAAHYDVVFDLITFKTSLKEVIPSFVTEITNFGAFLALGPIDGMVHITQTMDDYVSFTKDKVLQGKDTNRTLKIGDLVRAEVIAVSYKDINNPKIGLTMRRKGLGKLDWIKEDLSPEKEKTKSSVKGKGGKK